MSRLKLITKYFVRNALDEMFVGSKMKPGFIIALMIIIVCMLSLPFTLMISESYETFHSMGQEGMLIAIILSLGTAVSFFFGVYTIMNVFYFADDIEVILPLPFKSSEIIFGKFIAVLINMYIYTGMLILPLAAYGVVSKAYFLYYLYGMIVLVITPILPMILAALICMVLMRFTSLSKHKDAFKMFTGCASLILIIAFNYLNSNSGSSMTSEQILEKFSQGNNNTMEMLTGVFITNKFSAYGLLYNNNLSGLINIVIALIISIIFFIAYYYIGGKLYLKGVIGLSESFSRRENILETGEAKKLIKINSPLKALIKKDIKTIFRTPQFFINCVAMIFYMPIVMGVGFLSNGNLEKYTELLKVNTEWYGIVIVITFIGGASCIMAGGAGATALSREGKDFIVAKYIPVDYKTQLYSKILSSLCINEVGTLVVSLGLILIKASPILFALGIVSAFGSILLITLFGIYIDFRAPKLAWENEKAMFKKNYMPLFVMLIIFILGGILVVAALIIKNFIMIFGICLSIVSIGCYILFRLLFKLAYKVYTQD
ncbi:putative ABC transporter permease subunit [Clostridium chromiireducens]|uniref:putative ABC transporter permease subunit n=1 Tax=Clostridium chromiireducens TaxID=225345 RepID=UPI003AF740F9